MRRILLHATMATTGFGLVGSMAGFGQTHKVAKPEEVVRAVGVYEWLGDESKPTASRLIPVTLFVDGELQDAGVYLARPVPLAIDTGTVYEVDKAGVSEGTLDVKYASHLQAPNAATYYDDGWFGYGTFSPPPKPKKMVALKESKAPAQIVSSDANPDSDRPTFVRRHDPSTASSADAKPAPATTDSTSPAPPEDPNRPHMSKRSETPSGSATAGTDTPSATAQTSGTSAGTSADTDAEKGTAATKPGPAPANDPDRPTLKKRTPEEAKKARKESEQSGASGLATSLNDDPNRPTLHRGKGVQPLTEDDLPKLKGVPINLHQAVAVSDAATRPAHDFSRPWADDAERTSILAKMQILARAQIAAYKTTAPAAVAPKPATPVRRTPNSNLHHSKAAGSPAAEPLEEEQLKGYTLSYGGAATYVYTAHTAGEGAALRYVTVVAQIDAYGELKPAIQSVTDATHLDRTPWMRLVDVVDADASNRASLLFEMRGQSARQFALYRVIAARPEQTFLTGTTQ